MARVKASHSFRPVLGLVFVSFVFMSAAPATGWARSVLLLLQCATLAMALWTSGLGQDRRPMLALVAISVTAAVGELFASGDTLVGLVWLLELVLAVAVIVVVGLGVIDQREVNRQSVLGAVSVYVLLGMAFAFVFGAVAALGSGSLFAQGTDGTPSIRLYFSYVTLATLGYGDYTPAGNLGRTLAVTEALVGQLYLVTVVAVVVGHLGGYGRRRNGGG